MIISIILIYILIYNVKLSIHLLMAPFDNSPGMKKVSHCGWGLLFLDDQWQWALWVLLLATHEFSSEKSIQVLCGFIVNWLGLLMWAVFLMHFCCNPLSGEELVIFSPILQVAPLELTSSALHGVMQVSYGLVWCPLSVSVTSWIQVNVREHFSIVSIITVLSFGFYI